jgi:hypothetical protein
MYYPKELSIKTMKKRMSLILLLFGSVFLDVQANSVPTPAEAQIFSDDAGEVVYNLSSHTTYHEIKYTLGTPARRLDGVNVIDSYYLSSSDEKEERYDYLEILFQDDNIVSYALVRKKQQDLVAKAAKQFSADKYTKLDKLSIMTVMLDENFQDCHANILNLPGYEFTSKANDKSIEYVVDSKKLAIFSDAVGKVNRVEMFLNNASAQ